MKALIEDVNKIVELLLKLWPSLTLEEADEEIKDSILSENKAAFTHIYKGQHVAIALCSLRYDYVEGCETSPVGYLEGIYVDEKHRNKGIAKSLCIECEEWAKEQGASEFASDCELTNTDSLNFHLNIGFSEENRIICFKKNI